MNLMFKISYGLYIVSASNNGKSNGCITNTLMQQTSNPEMVSITVNKSNLTHDYIMQSNKCCVSILSTSTKMDTIKTFGFNSGRTLNKFDIAEHIVAASGVLVPTNAVIGYLDLEVVSKLDMPTHTQFLCKVAHSVSFNNDEALTYNYYQQNIKPQPAATVATATESYVCKICGYVHSGALSDDIICPICKHTKEVFQKIPAPQNADSNIIKQNETKGEVKMKKFVCMVCGYIHEGDSAPEFCPVCKVPASKFKEQASTMTWATEHEVGVAQGVSEDIINDLRANFDGECCEVGMYLAMSRVAFREGYAEIGMYYEKAAYEEAEHASKFAELLGEKITNSTQKNLELRVAAENGATMGKFDLAKRAKAANLDAIHDTVHEMAKDEARHGKAFQGLLTRYFK